MQRAAVVVCTVWCNLVLFSYGSVVQCSVVLSGCDSVWCGVALTCIALRCVVLCYVDLFACVVCCCVALICVVLCCVCLCDVGVLIVLCCFG